MKIVVLKPRGEKLVKTLIDTNEEPDYREKYLPENGECWECHDESVDPEHFCGNVSPIAEEEAVKPEEVTAPPAVVSKTEKAPKSKKPITHKK